MQLMQSDSRGLFLIDHLPKATAQGRNTKQPIGSSRKLALIRGSALRVSPKAPFGIGRSGRAELVLAKDATGEVGALVRDTDKVVAVFEIDSTQDAPGKLEPNTVLSQILPPAAKMGDQRVVDRMHEITEFLHKQRDRKASHSKIGEGVGRGNATNRALESLVANKYLVTQPPIGRKGAQTDDYVLVKLYPKRGSWSDTPANDDWGDKEYD